MALLDDWIEKAEADLRAAAALARRRKEPTPDIVCYLCQQSAEKYLKAYLVAQGAAPPRTHDLLLLVHDCATFEATLLSRLPLARALDGYGVLIRYPGVSATVAESKGAVKTARALRRYLRRKLGLP